jgi:ribosomal protein S14
MVAQQRKQIRAVSQQNKSLKKQLGKEMANSTLEQRLKGTFGKNQIRCLKTGQRNADGVMRTTFQLSL